MENPRRSSITSRGGFEENIMAILDSSGVKQARDLQDDRLSFLEAVRTAVLVSESSVPPSWDMLNATFEILRDSRSLELAMASYHLLADLDKRYPRVYLTKPDNPGNPSSPIGELVVVKEAWSPFNVGSEATHVDGDGSSRKLNTLIDPSSFVSLVEDIAQSVNEMKCQLVIKTVEDMLLFQYLVNVIEADFLPRQILYKGFSETSNWVLFRESMLNMLLVSRKLNFKSLVRDCLSIISERCHHNTGLHHLKNEDNSSAKITQDCDVTLAIAVSELEKETCIGLQKLLTMIMELDVMRKEADLNGSSSRVDGLRTPLLEIVLDELIYNKDLISPFLMVFSETKWKLEIILQYFSKYYTKPSVRTRRSTESFNDATFEDVLNYFSTPASTKSIVKKITPEVTLLLLAHAFQAYLSLQHDLKLLANFSTKIGGITLSQACSSFISAFQNLRKIDEDLDVTSYEKEALFTAGTILSEKS